MKYLHLISFRSLFLLIFLQLIIRYGFLKLNNVELALTNFQYLLLVFATFLIAGGGYVINNISDQDSLNNYNNNVNYKTFISENSAYKIYFALNIIGVSIGYYLSNAIQRPSFLVFFILAATLLYFYSSQLKNIPLLGNTAVSFLVAFSIIIIGFFDLFPATDATNKIVMRAYFSILTDYALFAFLITLILKITNDLERMQETIFEGLKSVPISVVINKTKIFTAFLNLILIILILFYINNYLIANKLYYATIYVLIAIVAPLIYTFIGMFSAKIRSDFHQLCSIFYWIIFLSILSIFIISKNIIYNVI